MTAVALATIGWGFTPVFAKLSSLDALALVFYRHWLGLPVMLVAVALARRKIPWRTLRASVASGALFGLNNALFFSALKHTSAANATLISNMQPALILLVAAPWFGEHVRLREVAWTTLAIGGIALVLLGSAAIPAWSPVGDLMAFGALLAWCGFFLMTKRLGVRAGALEYMTGVVLGAAIVITPLALISGQSLAIPGPQDLVWVASLIVVANGGHLLMTWAHRHVDVSVSSVILLGVPLVAAIAAFFLLEEALRFPQIAGIAIVLLGMGMIARRASSVAGSDQMSLPSSYAPAETRNV